MTFVVMSSGPSQTFPGPELTKDETELPVEKERVSKEFLDVKCHMMDAKECDTH